MQKLKIVLQYNFIYYIIVAIALCYLVITSLFITYQSKYDTISDLECEITAINVFDDKITFAFKAQETILGTYYLNDNEELQFQLGDYVLIKGEEQRIINNTVPNTFNYKKYLYNKKIFHVLNITDITLISPNHKLIYRIKNYLLNNSNRGQSSPYIKTLIFGETKYIDSSIKDSFRTNGVSHLFAISGLHINVFMAILLFIFKKLKISMSKYYGFIIVFLLFYMFLTDYPMSIVRAGIFTCLSMIDKIAKLNLRKVNLLLLALAIVIFINPLLTLDIGFLYSFSISLTLLLFQSAINKLKLKYIPNMLLISLISFLVSFPITVNNFYQINFLSIIYNLFFVPFVSFILLPLTLITYILPFMDKILFFFIRLLESCSLYLSSINMLKIAFCKVNMLIIISYYVFIYIAISGILKRKYKLMIPLLLLMVGHYLYPSLNNESYLMMIDQRTPIMIQILSRLFVRKPLISMEI